MFCHLSGKSGNSELSRKLLFVAGDITMWCNFLMNVLAIFMVEEFYIYAVVQFFFLQEKKCNV